MTDSLEAYPHVSIGERLRTLEDEAIDSSSWLAPIASSDETNSQPVTVVNDLSREELAKVIEAQSNQPLGCLSVTLEQYAELLRWLAGSEPPAARQENSDEQTKGGATILSKFGLDPSEFSDLVHHFGKRFFTAAGGPTSLHREARDEESGVSTAPVVTPSSAVNARRRILKRPTARISSLPRGSTTLRRSDRR